MGQADTKAAVGDVIDGRYRLLDMLGQGGMGQVFRAEHVGIKREVAIKLLHSELRDHEGIQDRVMREAFATGRLDHPNCVAITDSGLLEGGGTYLVMELLRGESLGDRLDRLETLPLVDALRIARDILKGLEHAHGVGVVHRDLKPDNIFLVDSEGDESAGRPVAKILDFGIAKLLGDAKAEAGGGDLTEAGMAIGSPTYMSPEQATGGEIDGRTDLYTLSLIFYEMVMGEPPFFEPDDKVRALQRRLKEKPPSLQSPSGETIPGALKKLLLDGLAKAPNDRVPDARTYLERLESILAEIRGPVATPPPMASVPTPMPFEVPTALPGQVAASPSHVPTPAHPPTGVQTAAVPSARASGPSELSPEFLRKLYIGGAAFLGAVVLIALIAGFTGGDDEVADSEEVLVMEPDHLDDEITVDPAVLAAQLAKELDVLEAEIEAGRGADQLDSLKRLQLLWPDDARTNCLLGLAYMDKRYWADGFKYLRSAISIDGTLRSNPLVIKAAIRSLSSQSKPGLGQRFLVQDIGAPAIPYLEETAEGGSKRQKKYAERALEEIRSAEM